MRIPALLAWMALFSNACPADTPDQRDLVYGSVNNTDLVLDVYHPTKSSNHPHALLIWIHGGAWRAGTKDRVPVTRLTQHGIAVASVEYRLSPVARFPAQVHDIKAAIRFLRAHSDSMRFDAERFVIAGASAGGHLAAITGVTNGHKAMEGDIGDYRQISSDVQAIVSFYGASNLDSILSQSTPHGLNVRVPALNLLLGEESAARRRLSKLASPVNHIDASDPPLILLHGDQDPQMPINQAHELHGQYKQRSLNVEFHVIHGAAHGGKEFYKDSRLDKLAASLLNKLGKETP